MRNRIAIIIPYFGIWPDWIDLYFYSCSKNSEIDWFFFTDCYIPESHISNMHFHSISFKNYCCAASERLRIDFNPSSPYKLCGLKPFYGYIHQDLISGYDFWGFGDIDVVWGDIKSFYTDSILSKYNVLSTHSDRISGHLTIIKNTQHYRELCFRIKDWKAKLQDQSSIALDEADFSWIIYPEAKYINKFYSKIIRKSFNWRDAWVIYYKLMPFINFFLFIRFRKLYFKEQHTTPILSDDGLKCKHDSDSWHYHQGKITNSKTPNEYIYLHFMIFKKNSFRESYFWKEGFYKLPIRINNNDLVIIDKSGIHLNMI